MFCKMYWQNRTNILYCISVKNKRPIQSYKWCCRTSDWTGLIDNKHSSFATPLHIITYKITCVKQFLSDSAKYPTVIFTNSREEVCNNASFPLLYPKRAHIENRIGGSFESEPEQECCFLFWYLFWGIHKHKSRKG